MKDITNLWINILLPVLSIGIPVFVTIYTVNNRIKNNNRENHQPYLILDRLMDLEELNIYNYHLTPIGKNFMEENPIIDYDDLKSENDIYVRLFIKNIGYGVASNTKFYNLITGEQVHGNQETNYDKNQQLFTTFDIQADKERSVQTRIINLVKEVNNQIIEDQIRMLCVYTDLNGNVYDFIISINAKGNHRYDFFAYQPLSKSYKGYIKEHQKEYKRIMKEYQ